MLLFIYLVALVSVHGQDFASSLVDPTWQDIIAQGGMHIGGGRAKRFIAIDQNQANVAHQECVLPNGQNGRCRHLRHCVQDEFRSDFIKFMEYVCIINHESVGACCPEKSALSGAEGLAGDLPATAPKEEKYEAIMKVTRAETRGCGLSTRQQSRVLGARPANPREWPWMASVTPEGFEQYCGGVLITDRHVLTAAHCTRRWKAEELLVRLGEYDFRRSNDSRTYNFKVSEIRQHEAFEIANYKNDIAILKLDRPAIFNTYVWPICLPPLNLPLTDEPAIVIGWGTQFYGGPHSTVLMEVSVPVWDHDVCAASFSESIFNDTICAGGREGGKDACQGDSGGPLMYQMESGRWTVIGVVSWGLRCGEPNHPGIYARVDRYLGWIARNARF
ncbi:venom protease-like [Trichoplusia ni]|uniref:Phenoloxidase-activating factor 2 n=1 Tax=Trichoplusia ni TaxID=7111 RepID=A0A7E5W5E6_TRINI|nr:venom protease-like [Trichoplusia ni]